MSDLIERQVLIDYIEGIRGMRAADGDYDAALCDVLDVLTGWRQSQVEAMAKSMPEKPKR